MHVLPLFSTVMTSPLIVLNRRISSPVGLYQRWLAPLPSLGAARNPPSDPETRSCPVTSILSAGDAVPMPTLPLALISTLLVGAPGRILKRRRLPPVTSRTKKLASFPAMSQGCAVKPPEL